MKKWLEAEIVELNISDTENGRPDQKVDGAIWGIPVSLGPKNPNSGCGGGSSQEPNPDPNPTELHS